MFNAAFYDEIFSAENTLRGQSVIQACRFDSSTMTATVAVNGRLLKTANVTKKPITAAQHLHLGSMSNGQHPIWGHIRNLRIWLHPLSDEQMGAIA